MKNLMDFQKENVKTLQELSNKKMGDTVVKFTTTTQMSYNFCICEYGIVDDIANDLEHTLNMLIDAKKSDMEIYSILGAFIPTEEEMEEMEEFGEYYNIDLGYCINGLITSWETVVIPEKTETEKMEINVKLQDLFFNDSELYVKTCKDVNYITEFLQWENPLFYMEDFDSIIDGWKPSKLALELSRSEFDIKDNYFTLTDNGNLVSFYQEEEYYNQFDDILIDSIWENLDYLVDILDSDILDIIL